MVFEAYGMSFPCTELLLFNCAKVNTVFHSMAPLRSLLAESEIFVRNVVNLHTASETFVRHKKKIGSGLIFCVFASVASILIGKDDESEKTHTKISGSVCNVLYSAVHEQC